MRRQTLDGERTRDADFLIVLIRLVVQVLDIRLRRDGRIDFLLPRDSLLPATTCPRSTRSRVRLMSATW